MNMPVGGFGGFTPTASLAKNMIGNAMGMAKMNAPGLVPTYQNLMRMAKEADGKTSPEQIAQFAAKHNMTPQEFLANVSGELGKLAQIGKPADMSIQTALSKRAMTMDNHSHHLAEEQKMNTLANTMESQASENAALRMKKAGDVAKSLIQ